MIEFVITKDQIEHHCLIDDEDADLLKYKWWILSPKNNQTVYVCRTVIHAKKQSNQYLHRLILERIIGRGLRTDELVDHRDRDGRNNARVNLRLATFTQNIANSPVRKNNKLGVKGVHKRGKKFVAQIRIGGKKIHLGSFHTLEEAHQVYSMELEKQYGEFAKD